MRGRGSRVIVYAILLISIFASQAHASDPYPTLQYYKTFNVTERDGVNQTYLQVNFSYSFFGINTSISAGKMQSDMSDLKFTDINNNTINYWRDDGNQQIWLNLTNMTAFSTKTFVERYGATGQTSSSSGYGVFEIFEDCNSGSLNTTTWTQNLGAGASYAQSGGLCSITIPSTSTEAGLFSNTNVTANIIIETGITSFSGGSGSNWRQIILFENLFSVSATKGYAWGFNDNGNAYIRKPNIYGSDVSATAITNSLPNVWSLYILTTGEQGRQGATLISNQTDTTYTGISGKVGFVQLAPAGGTLTANYDWFRTRKYVNIMPNGTAGTEQTVPQNGLNVSVFNGANGTAVTNWAVSATNGTTTFSQSGNSNPTFLNSVLLPSGTLNLTFSATGFRTNTTLNVLNNASAVQAINGTLWREQYFFAVRADTGASINTFNISFNTAGNTFNATSVNGLINISLADLVSLYGSGTATIQSAGFNISTFSYNFNSSSAINRTLTLSVAGFSMSVVNEKNTAQGIIFDIILTNGTCSVSRTGNSVFTDITSNLCTGVNKISIVNTSSLENGTTYTYPSRDYYLTLSQFLNLTMQGYLLRSDKGTFCTITVQDFTGQPIQNALITAQRQFGSSYATVQQEKTDSAGSTNFFLDYTNAYQMVVTADGYVSLIFTLNPSVVSCQTIARLQNTGATGANLINLTTTFTNISYSIMPTQTTQNQSFTITFFISSSDNDLQYFGMNVYYQNFTNGNRTLLSSQTINNTPSGGSVLYTTGNETGYYIVSPFFKKGTFDQYNISNVVYMIPEDSGFSGFNVGNSEFSIGTLQIFGAVAILLTAGFFFSVLGLFGGFLGGFFVLALLTFGLGIYGWQVFALAVITSFALIILKYV